MPELAELKQYIIPMAFSFAEAILILIIGWLGAKVASNILQRVMKKARVDAMLVNFVGNIIYSLILIVVAIAVLEKLGVATTSLAAILGAAGLAIGLAFKDQLSNLSAGIMLVIFRPFKKGHFVEAAGISGTVDKVNMFHTVLKTGDNKVITLPNAKLSADNIINYSSSKNRRLDMTIGVSYEDDLDKVEKTLSKIIKAEKRILKDPAPAIVVNNLADSAVEFVIKVWLLGADYHSVRTDLNKVVKQTFDKEGIQIPYPQLEVHKVK